MATAIVNHFLVNAQVAAGIPTSGSPSAQITILPGVLM
jgi:hypothetical protein